MSNKFISSVPSIVACFLFFVTVHATPAQEPSPEFPDFDSSNIEIELPEEMEGFPEGDFGAADLSPEQEAAATALSFAMVIGIVIMSLVGLALTILVAYLLMDALNSVPVEHQQLAPWVPWLLLVPFVNIVVLILAFIKVPDSLASYLSNAGNSSQGDCGKKLGLWGAVLYLLGCTSPIGIVLLIISLTKINQAKKLARASTT